MSPELIRPLTSFAYILAAVLCLVTGLLSARKPRAVWLGLTIVLSFLGISKQWNLIPEWMSGIRDAAWLDGWYDVRRIYQAIFIVFILLFILAWFIAILKNAPRVTWVPITATTMLLTLSIVRAVSLHAVDLFLYQELAPNIQPNWLIELGALALVLISALISLIIKEKSTSPPPPPIPTKESQPH